jgi:hypothetical protein
MRLTHKLFVALAAATLSASTALAWGRIGHQTVGALADDLICPAAKNEVTRLLALEGSQSLEQIARWADRERADNPADKTVHSVRTPIDAERFDETRDCGRRACAVTAIRQNSAVLADKLADDMARLRALKFVVHLVGDIHQPMHTVGQKKRKVIVADKEIGLHGYWDSGLFRAAHVRTRFLVKDLLPRALKDFRSGDTTDVADWANESHIIVRDYIATKMFNEDVSVPLIVSQEMSDANMAIARERIALAGARLAILVNRDLGCGG